MHEDNRILIIEPSDAAQAIAALLAVLAEHVRTDRLLQKKVADALAPVVTLKVSADETLRGWFER